MGAGALKGLDQEVAKPLDGNDLDDLDYAGVREEVIRLRTLLCKYCEEGMLQDASDICDERDGDDVNRGNCLKEVLYVRQMIRMNTAGKSRSRRETVVARTKSQRIAGLSDEHERPELEGSSSATFESSGKSDG